MTMTAFSMLSFVLRLFLFIHMSLKYTESLQCYACPKTERENAYNSNIQCLSNGYEVEFDVSESRCFSLMTSWKAIEKGCTAKENCNRNSSNICCGADYCNAGYGLYPQTGYGKECYNSADCVQGNPSMECRQTQAGSTKACECLPKYQVRKAVCVSGADNSYDHRCNMKHTILILCVYTLMSKLL